MKKSKIQFLFIFISFLFTFYVISKFFSTTTDFSNFALGIETTTYWSKDINNNIIHVSAIDSNSIRLIKEAYKLSKLDSVILILGNSQSHSINQMKDGQTTYVEILHYKINNYFVFADTYPNASMSDFLITYNFWKNELPIKAIFLPVFMDDLRETNGIEDDFYPYLNESKYKLKYPNSQLINNLNSEFKLSYENIIQNKSANSITKTTQEKSEFFFNNFANKNFPIWNNRKEVKGLLFGKLYNLRNTIFNIKATTTRRMLPNRYKDNFDALKLILEDASSNKIKILLYIPPIRSDVIIPYNIKEYNYFKNEVKELININKNYIYYSNFEKIVPSIYFGFKGSTNMNKEIKELDFMHFQYNGHKILADSLYNFYKQTHLQ